MAEEILDNIRNVVDGSIDFDGQRRAEGLATLLLALSGLVAFNVGYYYQDIEKAVCLGLGGTVLAFLLVVPPWPFFNKNPVEWLPAGAGWQQG